MGTSGWRWDIVTHVGFFGLSMDETGTITDQRGWDGAPGEAAVREAHEHGARIVPVAICFDQAAIHELVTAQRDTAVANLAAAVNARGADGVNIDFEGLAAADRTAMVEFMTALRAALPAGHLSIAVPAVDWSNAWDYAALADVVDRLILMGYDYHWRTSDPGPVAPLSSGEVWSYRNVTWSVDDLLTKSGGRAAKVLLGVPLYGYDYPSAGPEIPGQATAEATSIFYRDAEVEAPLYGRLWDEASQTPYYLYQEGAAWHQVWFEDAESLGGKLDLAVDRGLAGVALWALNYESASAWSVLEERLGVGGAGAEDAGLEVDAPSLTPDAASDTCHQAACEEKGCSCRVVARGGARGGAGWLLALVGLIAAKPLRAARRRRSSAEWSGSASPRW